MAAFASLDRATTWGHLTWSYLTEIMAEGVYAQVLNYLAEPTVHTQIHRFLDEERHHALGLRAHIPDYGPTIPEPLIAGFRLLSRLLGLGFALRGTGAFMDHVNLLEDFGVRWYGELADRFPAGSAEAARYQAYRVQEEAHRAWLTAKQAEGQPEGLEVVEFASVVPAPVEEVFALYTDTRSLTGLLGVPVRCPEGITQLFEGAHFHLIVGPPPLAVTLDARISEMARPHHYVDVKTEVPFDHWEHHHHFTALSPQETLLGDRLLVKPRLVPAFPEALQPSPWKLALLAMLWWRHLRTQQLLAVR